MSGEPAAATSGWKYLLASRALKAASATTATRFLYRKFGNAKRNYLALSAPIEAKYFFRTKAFLSLIDRNDILRGRPRVLEMGTGWVHWESTILRNRLDCDIVLYDVWDNRSFRKFRSYARQLADPAVRERLGLDETGRALMEQVAASNSHAEAYDLLNFTYRLDPAGRLEGLADAQFDFVMSSDVGEHLPRRDVEAILSRSFDILRPGGWAYHQVVLVDHLTIYDRSAHPKAYLQFPRSVYEARILSDIQYINLLQIPEWLALFEQAGFETVATRRTGTSDLTTLDLHPEWRRFPEEDLACTVVQFLLRRPAG